MHTYKCLSRDRKCYFFRIFCLQNKWMIPDAFHNFLIIKYLLDSWRDLKWQLYTLPNIVKRNSVFLFTAWKVSVFGVFLVLIFPHSHWITVILRISPYSVWIRENTHQKKYKYGHFSSNVYDIIQRNKVALSPYLRLLLVPQVTEKSHNKICCFHEVVKFCFEHWAIYHELLFSMKSSENPWLSNNFRGNGS